MKARLSSFREVRPGCQKSSPSFLHLEKAAAFSSPFLLQCKQLSNDTDIAAWLTATTTRLLSSSWPRQQSPSPTLPLPSSFPFPLSLCIFVGAAKVHQSQRNRAACGAAAAFACNLLHFVARKLQTALGCYFAQLLDSYRCRWEISRPFESRPSRLGIKRTEQRPVRIYLFVGRRAHSQWRVQD